MMSARLQEIISNSSRIKNVGERIDFLSEQFLGTTYRESTLSGSAKEPERLVINLTEVDCFTFIDYVEAMRLSRTYNGFVTNLTKVRYRSGEIAFEERNHFFTDWIGNNSGFVQDVTLVIGAGKTVNARKLLNDKGDGKFLVEGISPKAREISYIPSVSIIPSVIGGLKTGDYAGIYSPLPGLDVSHVGIIIRRGEGLVLRHASLRHRKVLDEDFIEYLAGKPGIIIVRPLGQ